MRTSAPPRSSLYLLQLTLPFPLAHRLQPARKVPELLQPSVLTSELPGPTARVLIPLYLPLPAVGSGACPLTCLSLPLLPDMWGQPRPAGEVWLPRAATTPPFPRLHQGRQRPCRLPLLCLWPLEGCPPGVSPSSVAASQEAEGTGRSSGGSGRNAPREGPPAPSAPAPGGMAAARPGGADASWRGAPPGAGQHEGGAPCAPKSCSLPRGCSRRRPRARQPTGPQARPRPPPPPADSVSTRPPFRALAPPPGQPSRRPSRALAAGAIAASPLQATQRGQFV